MAYALLIVAACLCLLVAHPKNISTGSIYSYQNETQRAEQNGYTIGSSAFSCSSTSQCVRVLITQCDNNNPSQFICINSAYLNKLQHDKERFCNLSSVYVGRCNKLRMHIKLLHRELRQVKFNEENMQETSVFDL